MRVARLVRTAGLGLGLAASAAVPQPDGSLKRYFNEQDTTGTPYQRGSR